MLLKLKTILLLSILFSGISCGKDNSSENLEQETENLQPGNKTPNGINLNVATEGSYPLAEIVYVDERLKATSKAKAKYYMKKKLVGREIVWNDGITNNYWIDRQYFKETPIIKYQYVYYDIKNDNVFFAVGANELEGLTAYVFDGLAVWGQENNKVKSKGSFYLGKLHGDFTVHNANGEVIERYWYENGNKTDFLLKKADFYAPLAGLWEAEIENDHYYILKTQLYDLDPEGVLKFYQETYYGNGYHYDSWSLLNSGKEFPFEGTWKYIKENDTNGIIEFYVQGKLSQKATIKILNKKEIILKTTYMHPDISDQNIMDKELHFRLK